jgi:hypothetical protein
MSDVRTKGPEVVSGDGRLRHKPKKLRHSLPLRHFRVGFSKFLVQQPNGKLFSSTASFYFLLVHGLFLSPSCS